MLHERKLDLLTTVTDVTAYTKEHQRKVVCYGALSYEALLQSGTRFTEISAATRATLCRQD